ncbi:hypothetical protein Goarm_004739, partial [Gossypium armourianum]|nr:hypothetical protein [Gossypium armourianum]
CGQLVSLQEHQSPVLNGLPSAYDHVVSIVTTNRVHFYLQGILMALLDVEAHISTYAGHRHLRCSSLVVATKVLVGDLEEAHDRNVKYV